MEVVKRITVQIPVEEVFFFFFWSINSRVLTKSVYKDYTRDPKGPKEYKREDLNKNLPATYTNQKEQKILLAIEKSKPGITQAQEKRDLKKSRPSIIEKLCILKDYLEEEFYYLKNGHMDMEAHMYAHRSSTIT